MPWRSSSTHLRPGAGGHPRPAEDPGHRRCGATPASTAPAASCPPALRSSQCGIPSRPPAHEADSEGPSCRPPADQAGSSPWPGVRPARDPCRWRHPQEGDRVRPAPAAEVRLRERTGCGGDPCRQTNTNLTALTESLLIPLMLLNLPVANPAYEALHVEVHVTAAGFRWRCRSEYSARTEGGAHDFEVRTPRHRGLVRRNRRTARRCRRLRCRSRSDGGIDASGQSRLAPMLKRDAADQGGGSIAGKKSASASNHPTSTDNE